MKNFDGDVAFQLGVIGHLPMLLASICGRISVEFIAGSDWHVLDSAKVNQLESTWVLC
jgi:hypothetical protein